MMLRDYTDRNRTSLRLTGNKFEFRATSAWSPWPIPCLARRSPIPRCTERRDRKETGKGAELKVAVLSVLRKHIKETEPIRFNGNNYSKE